MTTYPHPACMEPDGGDGPCRGYVALMGMRDAQSSIVARVWKALGITDYAGANGKAIDELVSDQRLEIDRLKRIEAAARAFISSSPVGDDDKPYCSEVCQSEFDALAATL